MPPLKSTAARGYAGEHPKERRRWAARLRAAGSLPCSEPVHVRGCPRVISWGMAFDLAHDRLAGGYRGIAFPGCNRAEGARFGNRRRAARRRRLRAVVNPSRQW